MEVIDKCICREVLDEVLKANCYTMIAYVFADVCNCHLLYVMSWIVSLKEVFEDFVEVEKMTGEHWPKLSYIG